MSSYAINHYNTKHIFEHIELRHVEEILIQRNYSDPARIIASFFLDNMVLRIYQNQSKSGLLLPTSNISRSFPQLIPSQSNNNNDFF